VPPARIAVFTGFGLAEALGCTLSSSIREKKMCPAPVRITSASWLWCCTSEGRQLSANCSPCD